MKLARPSLLAVLGLLVILLGAPHAWCEDRAESVAYDLWYRFRSGDGQQKTSRVLLAGLEGEEVTFRFRPLRFRISSPDPTRKETNEILVEVAGSVQGQVLEDGSVRVVLQATRELARSREGMPRSGQAGFSGAKSFTAAPGETVSIELPPLQATEFARMLQVEQPGFFAGGTDAIILTLSLGAAQD